MAAAREGLVAWLACAAVGALGVASRAASDVPARSLAETAAARDRYTGDLAGMVERRRIRVLVVPDRTWYLVDRGTERGLAPEAFRLIGDRLNRRLKTGARPITVQYVPVSRDELIPALREGRGDVAAANLTVTPGRERLVAFTTPLATVREILVVAKSAAPMATLDDLSGRTIHVRPATSYYDSVAALSARMAQSGREPIRIVRLPDVLSNEDKLEMVNAGLLEAVVVEDYLARFWQQVLPDIVPREDLVLREDARIAFAVRHESTELRAVLDEFIAAELAEGRATRNILLQRYLRDTRFVRTATRDAELARLRRLVELFRKYGAQYDFDHLLIAAQGYQESGLDHSARSRAGAIGVMQVMPATGRALRVGDIRQVEPNIHAGTKYMRQIVERYFGDAPMDSLNQALFAFAAYNAGPTRMQRLRAEALARGLNPNVWFNHVELVVADRVGRETVQYVANIYKYYVAYRLATAQAAERATARDALERSLQ
jgi:membrane-bound lytic murein transglycosylase MltF